MPNPQTFLYIKPDYDDASIRYLKLTEPIKAYALKLGLEVVALEGEYATPELIYRAIEQYDPYMIFTCGHGCSNLTTTQNYADTFWVSPGCGEHPQYGDMVDMLAGRITYLLSCYSGAGLVPAISEAGGTAAVGYADEFTWVVDTDYPVEEDPFALSFFDCPNFFMSLILDGVPIPDAFKQTQDRYGAVIREWSKWIEQNPNAPPSDLSRAYLTLSLLEHDRDIMTSFGEGFIATAQTPKLNPWVAVGVAIIFISLFASMSDKKS